MELRKNLDRWWRLVLLVVMLLALAAAAYPRRCTWGQLKYKYLEPDTTAVNDTTGISP